jgi:DNA polymerase III delta prime subunit
MKHSLWVEKYRPKSISDIIFQDSRQKRFFESIVESGDLPNLLLQGVQGTGKTTVSKALVHDLKIDPTDVLTINCSDEKIDALRDKVSSFAMTFALGRFKVIRLEEMDYLSLDGQALLRGLIEQASSNARFIGTCNYINKVIFPLRSRLQEITFKNPDQDAVALRMAEMLDAEAVEYDPVDLLDYVSVGYPDIRKTIQLLQQNAVSSQGALHHKKLLPSSGTQAQEADWRFGLLDCLKSGDIFKARKLVCESSTKEEHEEIFTFLYKNLSKSAIKDKDQAIILIADYQKWMALGIANSELHLAALFTELAKL